MLILRERAEKVIDRQPQPARRDRFEQMQHAMQHREIAIRRDHIDVVALNLHPVLHLHHRHRRAALEQLHEDALVGRVEMLDDDKRQPAARWHMVEKQLQRLQPASRSTKAHDGKERVRRGRILRGPRGRFFHRRFRRRCFADFALGRLFQEGSLISFRSRGFAGEV